MSKPHTTRKGSQYEGTVPVLRDRARQAVVLNALEPEWEARFEAKSYGFRPGRGCYGAIDAIFATVAGRNPHRRWILDADLTAAFDRIDHEHLWNNWAAFPRGTRLLAGSGRVWSSTAGSPPPTRGPLR